MRILFLAEGDPEDPDASASGAAARLIRVLRERGHFVVSRDVELGGATRLLYAARVFHPQRDKWSAHFHLHPALFNRRSRNAKRAVAALGNEVDVVLQYGNGFSIDGLKPTCVWADTAARLTEGVPFSWIEYLSPETRQEVFECEARVWRHASQILTFSDFAKRRFVSELGLPEAQVVVGGTGPFADVEDLRQITRPTSGPVALMVGREWQTKGGPSLIVAFSKVRTIVPDARLVVVGPDVNPGLPEWVEFVGYLSRNDPTARARLVGLFQAASVFCFPSVREAFGVALVEAMYAGLPAVASDINAIPEILADGVTGFLVPPNNPELLAERLISLLSNPALATQMGEQARIRAESRFSWAATAERFEAALILAVSTAM